MAHNITKKILTLIPQFIPLNQIDIKYHPQLATNLHLTKVEAGKDILKKTRKKNLMHFLVHGSAEIRESFDNRYRLNHSDNGSNVSLESRLQNRSSVKAIDDCILLVVNTDQLDQYLTWSQDYTICYLDEGDVSIRDDTLIDDDYQDDWDNVFVQSKLASNLSSHAIHQLMSQLEDIAVKANDIIVRNHSQGDYFYLIKKGCAEVQTDINGPFKGERFKLGSGNYFGDEALVADTTRNATVTMISDGILGRLNIEAFNQLIKQHLVSPISTAIDTKQDNIEVLDIRFPIEYKLGHETGSTNMPISLLRRQLRKMNQKQLYVITPADDRRSELATYLMRQAGYQAYHLPSTTQAEETAVSV